MEEKTINICGKEVRVAYCAAVEISFEILSDKSINDIDFSRQQDIMKLSMAALTVPYERDRQPCPVSSRELMYEASPKELIALFTTMIALRQEWYGVSAAVPDVKPSGTEADPKNA